MVHEKSAEYAKKVCDDELSKDDFLRLYHAYYDGWCDSEPEKGSNSIFFGGVLIGIMFGFLIGIALQKYLNILI